MQRTLIVVCLALSTKAQSSSVAPELAPAAVAEPAAPTIAPSILGDNVLDLYRSRGWALPAFGAGTRDARAAPEPALVGGTAELTGPAGWLVPQPGEWPPRAGVAGPRVVRDSRHRAAREVLKLVPAVEATELTGSASWLVPQPGEWPPRAGMAGPRIAREWPPRDGAAGRGNFPRRAREAPEPAPVTEVAEPAAPASLGAKPRARNRALSDLTRKMMY